jgi:hypothetical protein
MLNTEMSRKQITAILAKIADHMITRLDALLARR